MTVAAKNRRIQAVKLADALNSIEVVPVSNYAKELSQSWVNGELTGEQMKTAPFFLRFNSSDTWLFYETRCPKGNVNKLAHIF